MLSVESNFHFRWRRPVVPTWSLSFNSSRISNDITDTAVCLIEHSRDEKMPPIDNIIDVPRIKYHFQVYWLIDSEVSRLMRQIKNFHHPNRQLQMVATKSSYSTICLKDFIWNYTIFPVYHQMWIRIRWNIPQQMTYCCFLFVAFDLSCALRQAKADTFWQMSAVEFVLGSISFF